MTTASERFTLREQRRIDCLQRRLGKLKERLPRYKGRSDSWTRAEIGAIEWVLRLVEADHGRPLGEIILSVRSDFEQARRGPRREVAK